VKRVLSVCFALIVCLPLCVYAASIDGVETQGKNKLGVGVDQEFLFDRDMELKGNWYWNTPAGRTLETKEEVDWMYRTMAQINYGLFDNFDVYVKLGTVDFKSKNSYAEKGAGMGDDVGTIKVKGENAFVWGVGAKGAYNLTENWIIGCDVQYLRHTNDLKGRDSWTQYNLDGSIFEISGDDISGEVTFQEWHIAPYVAMKLGDFTPYVGAKYSDLRTSYKTKYATTAIGPDYNKPKFKADDNFGVFVGTDYKLGKNLRLNVEGRFIDETAMSFSATYKF
jgi:opacity protein-like surface antigen